MKPRERVSSYYDRVMYRSLAVDAYEGSDFQNLGFWTPSTRNLREACENLLRQLLSLIPDKRGSILDVACGKGATTRHLGQHYLPGRVTGINLSVKQLATGRRNAAGSRFLAMDAASLAFADDAFDNILCVEAACHFVTREAFLRECHRVLRPGGRLVYSDLLISAWMERRAPGRRGANFLDGPEAYSALCRRVGFQQAQAFDATERCWIPYLRYYLRFLGGKLHSGEIDRRTYRATMAFAWVMIFATRYYVLGWAQKN